MAYTLTKAEQEVVIGKCADETEWCVYITAPAELPHYLRPAIPGGRQNLVTTTISHLSFRKP
jgi:hypothetical protein